MGKAKANQPPAFEPVGGRFFVAIRPPGYVIDSVDRLRLEKGAAPGVNWVPRDKLHLTLAFLGEVDPERQEELMRRLPEVRVHPFFLALEGVGVFPRKGRPQVLWAGFAPVNPLRT